MLYIFLFFIMANANETSPATPSACTKCGRPYERKPGVANPADLCESCDKARVDELFGIANYYEEHRDECCCHTYLGRECCMSPIHGDIYSALCIENGERFTTDFRAKDAREAMEIGREHAAGWGGECISVRKVRRQRAA